MPKRLGHFCWHMSAFSLKMLALFSVITFGLISVFIWRVSSKPLDISFAKDYIQSVMHDEETGNYALMDKAVLYWPNLSGPLYLQFHDGQLVNEQGVSIISVDVASISFSRAGLLTGRILPKAIVLEKPTLRLIRNAAGEIKMDLGQDEERNGKSKEQIELTTRIFGYIARPGRESAKNSLISRLQAFKIEDARLVIDDEIAHQSWSLPDFDVGFQSTVTGMKGYVDLSLPDVGLDTSEFHADLNYLWDQKNVEISADFKNIDIKEIAGKIPELDVLANQNIVLNAHIETILDENFLPDDLRVDIMSESGELLHPYLSDDPIPYRDLALHALYNYSTQALLLQDTKITVGGVHMFAKADLVYGDNMAKGAVKLWVDELEHAKILPLWPKILHGDNSEKWVIKKLSDGVIRDAWIGFDLALHRGFPHYVLREGEDLEPLLSADISALEAEFSFEEMKIDYRAPLEAITEAYGSGRFDLDKDELSVELTKGKLGDIEVKSAKLLLDRLVEKDVGDADITVSLNGGVADLMRFLSVEPINLGDDMNMDIEKVKGNAKLDVALKFPARKGVEMAQFKIGVAGTLNDLLLPDVIEKMDLGGKSLALSVKDGLVSLKGDATLESRPMDFAWETFLSSKGKPYKEKLTAKVTADPNIRAALGIDLSDFIEGSLPVDVSYTLYSNGTAKADIEVDVTNARFFAEPFGFEKKVGAQGKAEFTAHLKGGTLKKITGLMASGTGFDISKSEIYFKGTGENMRLDSGVFNDFTLGETKADLDFSFDDAGSVKIDVDAEFLDAQSFVDSDDKDKSEYAAPPLVISVRAKKMRTSPDAVIKDAKLLFDIDGQGSFNQMEMDAKIGAGKLFARFKPDSAGKRTFRLRADDAGAFLKAFNVYPNIRGGSLVIYGEPMRGVYDRNLRGKAEITNFRVVHAPALAKLLSIISITGLGEVLAGDGLSFDKLESDFSWLSRKSGSLLVLKDGRTSGSSLGLLFEGTFDNQKREIDVSGTIVPMSGLNKVIGSIPIIGDILTGGSGGVFAATYSLKGSTDDPEIFVNPLSIITPGILRRILWE